MGSVFGFVSSDVRSKIDILCEYRRKESTAERFLTIKTMITYEKEEELLKDNNYVSGARTLLRLHRGLGELVLDVLQKKKKSTRSKMKMQENSIYICIYICMYLFLILSYRCKKHVIYECFLVPLVRSCSTFS